MFTMAPHFAARFRGFAALLAGALLGVALVAQPVLSLLHLDTCEGSSFVRSAGCKNAEHAGALPPRSSALAAPSEGNHEHHDRHSCRICFDLLLVKLAAAINIPEVPIFGTDPATLTENVTQRPPTLRPRRIANPRGPPHARLS